MRKILLAICLLAMPFSASAGADALNNWIYLTEKPSGAYIGFEFRWGGKRPVEKYLHIRGVVPRMDGMPFTAEAGTYIQFYSVLGLNPFKWSHKDQMRAVAGLGIAYLAVSTQDSHSRRQVPAAPAEEVSEPEQEPEPPKPPKPDKPDKPDKPCKGKRCR